jgi:hypothetical protein
MNINSHQKNRATERLVKLTLSLLLLVSAAPVGAQSVKVFMRLEEAAVGNPNIDARGEVPKPGVLLDTASRFAGTHRDLFVDVRLDQFSMKNRPTDPFGLIQDPAKKALAEKKRTNGSPRRNSALPSTPLADIIRLIKVTTIMPTERKFFVGGRQFKESDEVTIQFQGQLRTLKVISVSASEVVFQDVDTNEKAALEIQVLPAGMSAPGEDLRPPGMISPGDEIPLQLNDSGGIR